MSTRILVFDMDGTLVQARGAAWEIFQDTAAHFELPIRSAEQFFDMFRLNFFEALDDACSAIADPGEVRQHFLTALRERYSPTLVPGMADVIKKLAPHYALAVMSSNAMEAIRRTMEAAGVASCFAHVFSADVESSKTNHLRQILADPLYGNIRSCSAAYVEDRPATGSEVVLITDTVGDVHEGVAAGVRVIGVSWGMHSSTSLQDAGAEFVACWPQELVARLLPGGSCRLRGCDCETSSCQTTGVCSVPERTIATEGTLRASVQLASARRIANRRGSQPGRVALAPRPAVAARPGEHADRELAAALSRVASAPTALRAHRGAP